MCIEKITWDRDSDDSEWEVACDECGAGESIYGEFQDCIEWMKRHCWKIVKEDGAWIHICPRCKVEGVE